MSFGIPVRNGLGVGLLASTFLSTRNSTPFSPASLFAAGEPGAWYDPSDLTTLYQDSAGTTPVTAAAQSVGLMLDKSQGLVLGPELVTNGTFDSGTTGWTASGSSIAVVGGEFEITVTAGGWLAFQNFTTVVGKTYKLTATMRAAATNSVAQSCRLTLDSPSSQYIVSANGVQTNVSFYFIATTTSTRVNLGVASGGAVGAIGDKAYFDVVACKELAGNHAFQSNSAQRPTYGVVPATGRRNLLTYTEDLTNAVWSAFQSVKVDADTFRADSAGGVGFVFVNQNFTSGGAVAHAVTIEAQYTNTRWLWLEPSSLGSLNARAWFDIQNGVVGSKTIGVTSSSIQSTGDGWYRCTIIFTGDAADTSGGLRVAISSADNSTDAPRDGVSSVNARKAQLETGSSATAYQRVVSSFDVTEAGVQSLSYISCDGTDDGMLTNTITPGIDKAQVFAGVRKLSDAANGMIAEMSINSGSSAGSFGVLGGFYSSGGAAYAANLNGSQRTSFDATAFTAPITNIFTTLFDIAGANRADEITFRVNSATPTLTGGGNANAGTGNFLAYPLYLGRRGGTTLPFNGNIYSMIVRFGANLTADQIAATEAWVNTKTAALPVDYNFLQTAAGDQLVDGNGDALYSIPIFG